jgi:hypothetical protein
VEFNFNIPVKDTILNRFARAVAACLNKGINLKHNIQGELVEKYDTGAGAYGTFTVTHNLGVTPDLWTQKAMVGNGRLYTAIGRGTQWAGVTTAEFCCSLANADVKIWLEFKD